VILQYQISLLSVGVEKLQVKQDLMSCLYNFCIQLIEQAGDTCWKDAFIGLVLCSFLFQIQASCSGERNYPGTSNTSMKTSIRYLVGNLHDANFFFQICTIYIYGFDQSSSNAER